MTGGFDPGRYTAAPLQTEGVIRFTGSPDAVFARIANHGALTDWVPMLKTVQVSHPKPMPPGESTIGTTRVLALRGGVTLEEIVYWDPPRCYAYTTEGNHWPIRSYVGFVGVERAAEVAPSSSGSTSPSTGRCDEPWSHTASCSWAG